MPSRRRPKSWKVMNYNRDVMIESGYVMRFRRTMITCSIDMDKIHSSALR